MANPDPKNQKRLAQHREPTLSVPKSFDELLRGYVESSDKKAGSKFKSTPEELARLMAISEAIKQGKISVDDVPQVLKHFRKTGKLSFNDPT